MVKMVNRSIVVLFGCLLTMIMGQLHAARPRNIRIPNMDNPSKGGTVEVATAINPYPVWKKTLYTRAYQCMTGYKSNGKLVVPRPIDISVGVAIPTGDQPKYDMNQNQQLRESLLALKTKIMAPGGATLMNLLAVLQALGDSNSKFVDEQRNVKQITGKENALCTVDFEGMDDQQNIKITAPNNDVYLIFY